MRCTDTSFCGKVQATGGQFVEKIVCAGCYLLLMAAVRRSRAHNPCGTQSKVFSATSLVSPITTWSPDQYTGLSGVVVPGTLRDSLSLLAIVRSENNLMTDDEFETFDWTRWHYEGKHFEAKAVSRASSRH
jgi:hypothetical protein